MRLFEERRHNIQTTKPDKFLDVEKELPPGGTFIEKKTFDSFYTANGAAGTVAFNGQSHRIDWNGDVGIKNVIVRALPQAPWCSTTCMK